MKFQGDFTYAMKSEVKNKMEKLSKYIDYKAAVVSYKHTKDGKIKVEVSIGNDIRASKVGDDFYIMLPDIVDKLESQIRRYKSTKLYAKKHCGISEEDVSEEADSSDDEITKEKTILINSETSEEAIDEMELLGHTFFVYKDVDRSNNVCIVYKRFDSTYGIIECR